MAKERRNYWGLVEQPEPENTLSKTELPIGQVRRRSMVYEVAEGDLSRAYIEWPSLLRHITHAPGL